MTAYDPSEWHELFVAVAGAAAALAGLLFVAVSLNLKEILAETGLSASAARPLGLLLAMLLMSIFGLTPGQPRIVLGAEITALGLALAIPTLVSVIRTHLPVQRWRWTLSTFLYALVSTVPMVVAGVSLMVGAGGGLYWVLGELIAGFAIAIYYAWILLVEILR